MGSPTSMFTGRHVACGTGVKCHPDRRSERLLLGVADGWIKGNSMSSFSTNWCRGISPQGQELRRVEAAYTPVKGVQKKCCEKWQNWEHVRGQYDISPSERNCVMCFDFELKGDSPSSPMPWICTFGSSLSLLLCLLSTFMCASLFSFIPLLQILMSVVPPPNLVAQRSTASTQWVPSYVRGSWFVAVATMLVPTDPNVLVWFAIIYSSYLRLICFFHILLVSKLYF